MQWFFNHFGTGEFFPDYEILKILGKDLCTPDLKVIDGLCEDVLFLICGFDRGDTNIVSVIIIIWSAVVYVTVTYVRRGGRVVKAMDC